MKTPEHERFHIKNLDHLKEEISEFNLSIPVQEDISILNTPLRVGRYEMANRFSVQPMEGFDAARDGSPGTLSFRRYKRYAAGGFGLIWFEATAVMEEARSNPGQFYIHSENVQKFRELVDAVRATAREEHGRDPVLIVQLTHSGRYSKPHGKPAPIIAHRSPVLDPKHDLPTDYPVVTDDYLDRLRDVYVEAAKLAAQAGFDGVDIKSCHRYLVSELLASFTREGRYGGSYENRTRLLRETLGKINEEVPEVFPTTRMNAYDAIEHPYGWGVDKDDYRKPDLTEPLCLIGQLEKGGAPILNISIGNPYYNPHVGRPYDFPVKGMQPPGEHPLEGMDRFFRVTSQIQKSYPDLPVIGSGYSWLRQFMPNVAAANISAGGASVLGLGRGAFAYPDTPREVRDNGRMDPRKCCITCSACTQIMRDGGMTGCVVRDAEIYGPQYRLARRFAMDRLREEARRCRNCEAASCSMGCPAVVNVPGFIRAFADDDIETAYSILAGNNALPEMCANICPSEVQCEGACLENIFEENPVPIRDIQLATCRLARDQGITGVCLPADVTGRRAAIVGGGPAGVAAAIKLLESGHEVTLYEKRQTLGGTPDTTIPRARFRGSQEEVQARLKPAIENGRLILQGNAELGDNLALDELRSEFDAVILAMGLSGASSLGHAEGVMDALAFLRQAKSAPALTVPDRVAVLGGGNTAMDAAVTARELGARDVYLVYRRSFGEMPAWPEETRKFMESGGHLLLLSQPTGYEVDENGHVQALKLVRTELGDPDASGRRRPEPVEGSETALRVDMVVEALGQKIPGELKRAIQSLELTGRELIAVGENSFATNVEGVFAAGDIISGGTTAVRSISEGMKAAEEVCSYLTRGDR
jgi:NADPH-dependent glutamate synthase beta subunit-like oxidoreductase/2,4-dienoyl-CoA reductase-like NADH-dependent reductase (Old Yellow Enzyme family)